MSSSSWKRKSIGLMGIILFMMLGCHSIGIHVGDEPTYRREPPSEDPLTDTGQNTGTDTTHPHTYTATPREASIFITRGERGEPAHPSLPRFTSTLEIT